MTEIFEGFGMHMMHAKIHETGEGCCCLKDLPCEHCPSHPDAYPSRLAAAEAALSEANATIQRQLVWSTAGLHGKAEDDRVNADKLMAINAMVNDLEERANHADELEKALSEARAALDWIADNTTSGQIAAKALAALSRPATETTEAQT